MQSAAQHVLAVLDRRYTPTCRRRGPRGTRRRLRARQPRPHLRHPGESDDDLRASLDAVLSAGVDHVSAYALIVEDGTALAGRVRRGELPPRRRCAGEPLSAHRRTPGRCRTALVRGVELGVGPGLGVPAQHRLLGQRRLVGIGPGAHSHVNGVRWWNHKHPARYAGTLADGVLPVADSETLDDEDRHTERLMLQIRVAAQAYPRMTWHGGMSSEGRRLRRDGLLEATPPT